MSRLGIILIIKIMVNSEIYITYKSEHRFSQQDEVQKSVLNGKEKVFLK